MKQKLQYFPITSFAVTMGLTGFAMVLGKFGHLNWLPDIFYYIFTTAVGLLFLFFAFLYILKMLLFFEEVKSDFRHPIRINFTSAISISLLLLSVAFGKISSQSAMILWYLGVALHTLFMLKTIAFWIQHNFEITHFNPSWFIPVVGNILVPVSGVDFAPVIVSYFYYSVGFFFWIVLFTLFLYRVIFHNQLPEKFIPTFFILLAPPAVGFISYIKMTGSWDFFSISLLMLTYFFLALISVMYKSFIRLKFYMSWWAFTFPLMATTIAGTLAFEISSIAVFKYLALLLASISAIIISIVGAYTVKEALKGNICIKEE